MRALPLRGLGGLRGAEDEGEAQQESPHHGHPLFLS
jgi:hypothetical protein